MGNSHAGRSGKCDPRMSKPLAIIGKEQNDNQLKD